MEARSCAFTKIINGNTQYVIPVFQRDYSWTEAQCEQLWKDLTRVAASKDNRVHFIGSVVHIPTGDSSANFTRYLLIDGQQRVTTLTLLLTALRDHIVEAGWKGSEDGPTAKRLDAYYLKNMEEEGRRHYKLLLRRHDQDTLQSLLDGEELPKRPSERIRENYEFFREQLRDADPEAVYTGFGRLAIVDVALKHGFDDPQLIFESLNSTGMDLSQSDLIRNFILMRLPEPDQTRLYDAYWNKIEQLFRGSERAFDAFVRDFIALKTRASKQEKADQVYFSFRQNFLSEVSNLESLESLLQELFRYAKYYAAFSLPGSAPKGLDEPFARLRRQVDVPAILIMRLYDCFDRLKTLSQAEFAKAIGLIDSYVFRRAVCGEQTRGYWREFATLAYRIKEASPLESLAVGLARKADSYRFPSDDEFRSALEERDLYGKRICFELLDRLENHGSKEPTDTSGYSIEHIMPQNEDLSRSWREMLGPDWREAHLKWLHRLGNLTLTGYNSSYSDRPFEEKKTIPGGFSESSVRLNKSVREQERWTPKEMEARGKALSARALTIWPGLQVSQPLLEAAKLDEKRELAARRNVDAVAMSEAARALFDSLRSQVVGVDSSVVEVAEAKSISYHGPTFFMEVLPRKNRLNLLLAPEFNEIDDPHGIAEDAAGRKFFFYAQHSGGVYVPVSTQEDIEKALPLIRQAWELSRS